METSSANGVTNGVARPQTSAAMLDALRLWILGEASEFPIRSAFLDERFNRATIVAEDTALETYRSTRSYDSALTSGKTAFKKDFVGSHLNSELEMLAQTSPSRATPDLWLEAGDEEGISAGSQRTG